VLLLAGGCTWDQLSPFKPPVPPPPPVESFVLRPEGMVPDKAPAAGAEETLAGARELFRREDYAQAEKVFHHLANHEKSSSTVAAEALFYEAECLRLQGFYPKAADTYHSLMEKFSQNPFREQALQHMYDIATFWLQDTWQQMRENEEKAQGKRWVVWPRFVSFEREKPLMDREGRAIETLEHVRWGDIHGPLADKALFMAGYVKLINEDWREADHLFTQLYKNHPKSEYAPQAIEYAIWSKHMCTGGSDYDGRKVAEARELVDAALRDDRLAGKKAGFLDRQLWAITMQQAEKDYKYAEFYRRTGHPGSAYFYYELVQRRYPNTEFAKLAAKKKEELRAALEKAQGKPEPKALPLSAGNDALGAAGAAASPQMMPGSPGTAPMLGR
jgi:TolA-binding protein